MCKRGIRLLWKDIHTLSLRKCRFEIDDNEKKVVCRHTCTSLVGVLSAGLSLQYSVACMYNCTLLAIVIPSTGMPVHY